MSMQELLSLMNNPQMRKLFTCSNPQQAIQVMAQNPQVKNNPMFQNVVDMINKGDYKGIENMGRNLLRESGNNPDDFEKIVNMASKH